MSLGAVSGEEKGRGTAAAQGRGVVLLLLKEGEERRSVLPINLLRLAIRPLTTYTRPFCFYKRKR